VVSFIVDENLPYYFALWKGQQFVHVFDIGDSMTDDDIWNYAKEHDLTIITKDADFSTKVLFYDSPPKVIHLKIGNMKIKELFSFLENNWDRIRTVSNAHKLTNVYIDRIEAI